MNQNFSSDQFYKQVFVEFVEVLIHQIIFFRKIYPDSIYVTRKRFNIPLKMSEHPWVNNYIQTVLETLSKHLSSESVDFDSVDVVIAKSSQIVEKFKLEFAKLTFAEGSDAHDFRHRLELRLASLLLRLGAVAASLQPDTSGDLEWWVELGSTVQGASILTEEKVWCLAQTEDCEDNRSIVPVMGFSAPFKLQLYVETQTGDKR